MTVPTDPPLHRPRYLLWAFAGVLTSIAAGALITLIASIFVCLGMPPEAIYGSDIIAPYLGILCGSTLTGCLTAPSAERGGKRHRGAGRMGFAVGTIVGFLWIVAWCFLRARWDIGAVWHQAIARTTFGIWLAWFLAGQLGSFGGVYGSRMRGLRSLGRFAVFNVVALWICMSFSARSMPGGVLQLSPGVTVETRAPEADGTIVRLITCDFQREPGLRLGLYDADSDDAHPLDDRDTEYLGASPAAVFDRLGRHLDDINRRPRLIINGGFFGSNSNWAGFHIAPIVVHGRRLYNTHVYSDKWPEQSATFGVRYSEGHPEFALLAGDKWNDLGGLDTALAGVRPLRISGRSLPLKPGPGNTTLRCSRTSVAWPADSSKLYILIVREPDGEAASVEQKRSRRPVGGWDINKVQRCWEQMGIANAVQFDSGESTQLVTEDDHGRTQWVRSAYQLAKTLGYWHDRPIRISIPMTPPSANVGGVLNYIYVDGDKAR